MSSLSLEILSICYLIRKGTILEIVDLRWVLDLDFLNAFLKIRI